MAQGTVSRSLTYFVAAPTHFVACRASGVAGGGGLGLRLAVRLPVRSAVGLLAIAMASAVARRLSRRRPRQWCGLGRHGNGLGRRTRALGWGAGCGTLVAHLAAHLRVEQQFL